MKILVPVKRVADPASADKVKVSDDGAFVDESGLESKMNPFDEWSLEAALRLTENGATKERVGEIVLASVGPDDAMPVIRHGLAMGAERGYLVAGNDNELDSAVVASVLEAVAKKEEVNIVFLGKQSADGESNVAGTMLAEKLGWPLVNYVSTIEVEDDGSTLKVEREIDTGVESLRVTTPCVLTSSDRILAPTSVKNGITPDDFSYPELDSGRYPVLKGIMKARSKPVEETTMEELGVDSESQVEYVGFEKPAERSGSAVFVESAEELIEKLKNEAKVL